MPTLRMRGALALAALVALPALAAHPPAARADTLTAPVITVSGQTLSWNAIAGVSSYVYVRKVPGQADRYAVVNATSITPPAVPGQTVRYSVRTNVTGSAWAREVSIAYPATTTTTTATTATTTTTTTTTTAPSSFRMGVAAGSAFSYELPYLTALGARSARLVYTIGTTASSMATVIDQYARAGVRPLLVAHFYGRLPTTAEAQNVATWAKAYGPGGSFWAGKTYPANTAVNRIEFGSETSYSYQFSDNSLATYATRAQTYALRFKDAQVATKAANPNVGLLAQGDNAVNGTAWVANVVRAVPDIGARAAGWTIHPYGPNWRTRIDSTISSARTAGASDLPIWVTEYGLSTDNGRCLSDNYGWSKCMTYAQAATTLHSVVTGMLSAYGSRLGAFYLYQAHDQAATGTQSGREYYFGALQSKQQAKGAYTTEIKTDLATWR